MKINETLSVLRPAFSAVLLFIAANAHAVGTGTIADGIGSIDKSGNTTTVNQTSHKLIVNWDHMNVGNSDTLNFVQPTSNSAVLNRISLADPTLILGTLNASDRVFIVNPNGVLIGNSAKINVASLIASSLNITDKNFKADRLKFTGGGKGDVINAGEINATESVALIGSKMVVNTGSITSANGDVVLAAADNIRLAFNGPHLQAELSKGSLKALVNNGGLIATQDGNILLTAWARDTLTRSVINNTGVLEASSLTARQSNHRHQLHRRDRSHDRRRSHGQGLALRSRPSRDVRRRGHGRRIESGVYAASHHDRPRVVASQYRAHFRRQR